MVSTNGKINGTRNYCGLIELAFRVVKVLNIEWLIAILSNTFQEISRKLDENSLNMPSLEWFYKILANTEMDQMKFDFE